ncbi:hypothetical protein EJ04DRAFT_446509 [Polyplosphaeria fusca]|uniref:Uncharacterized protein n=1 Tax=Polyplosphaeria fusca TaxID=682080 RepID=A0A9P4UZ18_9PLEO|nr:hypothetical protein EJ04DRAFT_446509 [Polyplosphaeria fusca]
MRAVFFTPIFALAAFAQDASSVSTPSSTGDAFPQTSFLTQTDSRGVVTGMPAPATSVGVADSSIAVQPPVQTSQPPVNSIPAVGTGVHTLLLPGSANSTRTVVVSANNSTTVELTPTPSDASGSGAATGTNAKTTGADASESGAQGSQTTGASGSQSTGAAPTMGALAGGIVGVGALVAAFL